MSLPRPSGLKQPSRIGRPTGLPTARPQTPASGSSTNQQPPSAAQTHMSKAQSPESQEDGISTDDFKIGDRVWVNDTKPGVIAFIGEADFAPGEWAGIVLDEPIGKNDGSVMGIRYFQCEPKRGVFSRLSKLSHTARSPAASQGHESTGSDPRHSDVKSLTTATAATSNGITPAASSRPSSRLGLSSSKNLSTSSSSLHKTSSAGATPTSVGGYGVTPLRLPGTMPGGVRVGDRVLVSGSKSGVLRYIGETDFAKGVWAGVELDEPMGKNDGAVAGKRYFDCKPLHGLFAPVHKISRAGSLTSTPSPHSRPLMSTSLRSSREHSGSQESVLSMSSTASSVSRSRVRLGVTSLASQGSKTGHRPSTLNLSATTAALQKALKEKEEHIEQLLRERDLERSEVARAAAHVDEAEGQLSSMRSEQDRLRMEAEEQITKYRTLVAELESEKQELQAFLEEEKRKVEDLQFQLEEETLKDDDDVKTNAASELQLLELERQAKKEKERADKLETDLQELKQKLEDQQKATNEAKNVQTSYLDQIEELTYKLTQAESRIKTFESTRLEDGAKTSQVNIELSEKQNRIRELEEQLTQQQQEMSSMSQQLNDVREELIASNEKRKIQEEFIQDLTKKLQQASDDHKHLIEQLQSASSNTGDLQRQLASSKDKAELLTTERHRLEVQLSELMKNSGDSSSQLAQLHDQLTERSRKIQDLQNDLSICSQSLATAEASYQKLKQDKDREQQETVRQYDEKILKLNDQNRELTGTVEKHKARATQMSEQFESEKKKIFEQKEAQVKDLQQQLTQANSEVGKQQDSVAAHKQLLEKLASEKEALQYEKQQTEKQLKRVDGEKCSINSELIQARGEVAKYQEEVGRSKGIQSELEDKLEKFTLQIEYVSKAKEEAERLNEELKSQKLEVAKDKDTLQQELENLRAEVSKKDALLVDLQKEGDKLQKESTKKTEELLCKSQTEADFLKLELDGLKMSLQETKDELVAKNSKITELQAQVELHKTLIQEKDQLLHEKVQLVKEKEAVEEKCRCLVMDIQKQTDKASELEQEVHTLKSSEATLRQDKSTLEGRIGQLETDLDSARQEVEEAMFTDAPESPSQLDDDVYTHLREEADSARGQVDFLNSVIVELQNKNQELMHRLSVMEDSGIHTNGEFSEPVETPTRSRAPPRLFCDICDVFDLHDTEDCPRQAMSSSPEPSRHHGDPKNARPYCDICEAFGHSTEKCDDEQTF